MQIRSTAEARDLFDLRLAGSTVERLQVVHLDLAGAQVGRSEHGCGLCDGVALPLRAIVADALRLGSRFVIIAHNHPSGDPTPSLADSAGTRALASLLRPLGIRLLDHLVFAEDNWQSFRLLGLL